MTLKERCQAGEVKLAQVSTALFDPRPEMLDDCETYLQEVIGLLEGAPADSGNKPDLLRLRYRIRLLDLQVQQATNLCQGWAQLGLSDGYTDQGTPVLPPSEPQSSYEV
jgi:hypothetical protein